MKPDRVVLERDLFELLGGQAQEVIEQVVLEKVKEKIDGLLEDALDGELNLKSSVIVREAAEAINAYRFVAADSDGKLVCAGTANPNVIGFIKTAVNPGETGDVYVSGVFTNNAWSFVRDRPLML
jgi:hypothetical protein